MAEKTRLIPAICTQCGGKLEVPDHLEKAHCIYCGTVVIIDKPKIEIRDFSIDRIKDYEDEKKYRGEKGYCECPHCRRIGTLGCLVGCST